MPRIKQRQAGSVPEPATHIDTRIPISLHKQLKLYCVERELSLMDVIARAIEHYLYSKSCRRAASK